MSDHSTDRDRSYVYYPREQVEFGLDSDSDPSEEIMIIDSDSEDSSIQMLPLSPPEIIDI